jgi:hypothetical protein
MRKMIIASIYYEIFSKLPDEVKNKPYVFKEIRKVGKKLGNLHDDKYVEFINAYKLADTVWKATQTKFMEQGIEYSTIVFMRELVKREPWMVKYFNINLKKMKKLEDGYNLGKHGFRTVKVVNTLIQELDETLAQYNWRLQHE